MMKVNQFISLVFSFVFLTSFTSGDETKLAAEQYVTFKIKNAGITVDGAFEKFNLNINYDAITPSKSTFNGTIEVESLSTGIEMRDGHLKDEDYFNAEKYPQIKFASTYVALLTNGQLKVVGNLTIKHITKSVELRVDVIESAGRTYFKTSLSLDRLDYQVGESSWTLSDEVKCAIKVLAL
jgi:polyisoprenoid-binding protein YceI